MKKPILITLSILYIVLLHCSIALLEDEKTADPSMISDISRMMPVRITKLVKHAETESIQETIKDAKDKNLKISIAGMRHSQGGHTYYKDAVVLDMTTYNKILEFNSDAKTITVQSGATWDDIQEYINPHNLAIKVMQSQNIFTIGGSLSVNVHGRDIRHGSLIESVNSFRLLKADGKIINVSRTENKELFPLVIGGYGLFGVILDVELQLTDDELYKVETQSMNYREYATYFKKQVKGNPDVRMHLARISTAPDAFLTNMYTTNYKTTKLDSKEVLTSYDELKEEHHVWLPKLLLGLSRDFNWGKNSLWKLQEEYFARENNSIITRNNVMRSESQFMEYENEEQTDILQEYFVPIDHFETYIDEMRLLLSEKELNLLNITIRYVEKNQDAVLSYAKDDMFALVLLINQGLSKGEQKKTENIIRKMIHITLKYDGSYYLPYLPYPSISQMHKAYPRSYEFFLAKKTYDNEELFMNYFYERYHNNDYQ